MKDIIIDYEKWIRTWKRFWKDEKRMRKWAKRSIFGLLFIPLCLIIAILSIGFSLLWFLVFGLQISYGLFTIICGAKANKLRSEREGYFDE